MALIDFGRGLREQIAQRDQRVAALHRDIDALNALVDSQARRLDREARRIDRAAETLRTLAIRIRAQSMAHITAELRQELVDLVLDVQLALKPPKPATAPETPSSKGELSVHKG